MSNGTGNVGNRMLKTSAGTSSYFPFDGPLGRKRKRKTKSRATRYQRRRTRRAGESTGSSAWTTFILGPSR